MELCLNCSYKIGNTSIYEQGCCCETKQMKYTDGQLINSQKEGFMFICLDKNGHVIDDNFFKLKFV